MYFDPASERQIRVEELRGEDRETQIRAMRHWFLQHYEDPAERTPYESREGGYIWIWGGPYYAGDVLNDEFQGNVEQSVIDDLAQQLTRETGVWAPTEQEGDYDEAWFDESGTEPYVAFKGAMRELGTLIDADIHDLAPGLYAVLFAHAITVLETYLGDTFRGLIASKPDLMRKFVETTPKFKERKVALADLFNAHENITKTAMEHLRDFVWHRLISAGKMYRDTLGIDWPATPDPKALLRAVNMRHHIVHRTGKDHDGNTVYVDKAVVQALTADIQQLVTQLEQKVVEINRGDDL
jgi:hypothetical protein